MLTRFIKAVIELIGGRKAALTLTVLAVGTAIDLYTVRGLSANMLQLLLGIGGIFVAGNVSATFAHSQIIKHSSSAPTGASSDPELKQRVQGISNKVELLSQTISKTNEVVSQVVAIVSNK